MPFLERFACLMVGLIIGFVSAMWFTDGAIRRQDYKNKAEIKEMETKVSESKGVINFWQKETEGITKNRDHFHKLWNAKCDEMNKLIKSLDKINGIKEPLANIESKIDRINNKIDWLPRR